MKTTTVYVALGSNVGDSARTLMRALKMLAEVPAIEVRRVSQFIRTEPVGGPEDQPAYLNGAAELRTSLPPEKLLHTLQEIEAALGRDRPRERRWGPRTCDLDILLYDEIVQNTEGLTIPHPRMHERLFVLEPLAQIAPCARHPVRDMTITELLLDCQLAGDDGDGE